MLCPAVSDPFRGQYYRLFAIGHQLILIPLQGKLLVVLARAFCLRGDECSPCRNNNQLDDNTCSQLSSIADNTKYSDIYEDSGFLGTGCALDSDRDSADTISNNANANQYEEIEKQNSSMMMTAVKRLVNGRIVDDQSDTSDSALPSSRNVTGNSTISDKNIGRNGHTKCH